MHVLSVLRNIFLITVYNIVFIIIKYLYLFHLDDLSPLCYPAYEASRIDPENNHFLMGLISQFEQTTVFDLSLLKNKLRAINKEDQCKQRLYALKGQHDRTVIFC